MTSLKEGEVKWVCRGTPHTDFTGPGFEDWELSAISQLKNTSTTKNKFTAEPFELSYEYENHSLGFEHRKLRKA